jgi:hypothetical protein
VVPKYILTVSKKKTVGSFKMHDPVEVFKMHGPVPIFDREQNSRPNVVTIY